MAEKEFVTWEQVEKFVDGLIAYWRRFFNGEDRKFIGVYGIPRGGSVLAVMISHRLNIPMLSAPCKGCLIVDDICDTGESLLHYVKNSSAMLKPLYTIATMYYKENDLGIVPNYYMYNKTDKWIVFPWESKEVL